MQLINFNRKQSGDTIVEVMLALSVLGLIIVGGYSIATRSLNGVRVSQERGEALKIAEAQIEVVRQKISSSKNLNDVLDEGYFAINPTWAVAYPGNPAFPPTKDEGFCVTSSGLSQALSFSQSQAQDLSQFPDECKFQDKRYHVHVTTDLDRVSGAAFVFALTYRVAVSWEKPGGGPVESINLQNKFLTD